MPRLIDADAVVALLTRRRDAAIATSSTYGEKDPLDMDEDECLADELDDLISGIEDVPTIKPQVVANISGGILQGASADYPVTVFTLDFDYDGETPESAVLIEGDEAWRGQIDAEIDPDFVGAVIDAPNLGDTE